MKVDYAAIADAVQPGEVAEQAFTRMAAETVTTPVVGDVYESELGLMSRLGVHDADAILSAIEAAVPERVTRMIRSDRGINLADPQTQGMVAQLVAGGVLTQADSDKLLATLTKTEPAWPGLKLGHVINAVEWRAAGRI